MSRSIILSECNQENNYIPVAPEEYFERYLYPLAEKLMLDSITEMAGLGYDFDHNGLVKMHKQFCTLKDHIIHTKNIDEPYENWFIEKVNTIIERLEPELENQKVTGYVG